MAAGRHCESGPKPAAGSVMRRASSTSWRVAPSARRRAACAGTARTWPAAAPCVAAVLAAHRVHAGTTRANLRGPLYRLAVRRALATGAARVHYLDLDRALRWVARTPRELGAALRAGARHRVLVLGRTPKAHRSHHLPLYATEA